MYQFPKNILTLQQQVQAFINSGMTVPSREEAEHALMTIGYYRLRGYCFQFYNNAIRQYEHGTDFSDILSICRFDSELSHLLFGMLSRIEVSLRARLVQALLLHNDALILNDPSVFADKKNYWQNYNAVASEIARSNDAFILHHFSKHEGAVPVWAAVEIMSFGTLSKIVKNLKTGTGSSFSALAEQYKYKTANNREAKPSKDMLSSWIHAVSVLRNMCAHNSRIYNRTINAKPELLARDSILPAPNHYGLYQILLAMKYLRPCDKDWNDFSEDLICLIGRYDSVVDLNRLNFPADWKNHFSVM